MIENIKELKKSLLVCRQKRNAAEKPQLNGHYLITNEPKVRVPMEDLENLIFMADQYLKVQESC